jgi:hypothetical protein
MLMRPVRTDCRVTDRDDEYVNWKEDGNLRVDWRWAGESLPLFERYTAELVALVPDVLLASGSLEVTSLRRQTSAIPIVFTSLTIRSTWASSRACRTLAAMLRASALTTRRLLGTGWGCSRRSPHLSRA